MISSRVLRSVSRPLLAQTKPYVLTDAFWCSRTRRSSRPPLRLVSLWRGVSTESVSPPESTVVADVFGEDSRPVILFDGVCNFCNAGVNLVLSLDRQEMFRFAALQSEVGKALLKKCNRQPDDISSMVVVEKEAFHLRSDAALRIGEMLQMPFPLFSALLWPMPKALRDNGYDWIAENRYKLFGMRDVCRLSDEKAAERFLS